MDERFLERRVVELNDRPVDPGGDCVVYWMQRSQRARDNLALDFAVDLANSHGKPVLTYFGVFDAYPMAGIRAFKFMFEGLAEVSQALEERGIGFLVRRETPAEGVARVAKEFNACAVVVDEDYLNVGRAWREQAARDMPVKLLQVDAETVVPARTTDKEEWGAYTIRPKITKVLPDYLVDIVDESVEHEWSGPVGESIDIAHSDPLQLASSLDVDQEVAPTPHFVGGRTEALERMRRFIDQGLPRYAEERNEIGVSVSSDMSPYFHFGQLSTLRAALMVDEADAPRESIDAYLEQLIVRRELAINFCLYNHDYDTLAAATDWARKTLDAHRTDERPELYSLEELENARTHDGLWNAAQRELRDYGKIHPYLRMVWAKNILSWSVDPEEALGRAIYLNDKYALDGRDPNGYTNIAWCIHGKHDRPFPERPIFGKVRYMSSDATKRKTRWEDYIERVESLRAR